MKNTYSNINGIEDTDKSTLVQNTTAKPIDLYSKIQEGINDINLGNTRPFAEAMADIKSKRNKSL